MRWENNFKYTEGFTFIGLYPMFVELVFIYSYLFTHTIFQGKWQEYTENKCLHTLTLFFNEAFRVLHWH